MLRGKCVPMRRQYPVKRWSLRELGPHSLPGAGRGHQRTALYPCNRRPMSNSFKLRAVKDGSMSPCPESYQVDLIKPPSQFALFFRLIQLTTAGIIFACALLTERFDRAVYGTAGGDGRAAIKLEELLTYLGPSFIKLAQTLSMRPDLIGESYASTLSKMQDKVKPFSNVEAMLILEEELGKPLDEIFEYLSPNPVASASLGQVYKGVLRKSFGDKCVAVKVQRPGAEELISVDIILLRQLLGVLTRIAGIKRDLGPLANDIGCALRGECDFRNEIANSEEFAKAHSAMPLVMVAPVVKELCTRRIMVSEWIDGKSPSQLIASGKEHRSDVLSMVNIGIQCSLSQLLVTGCMHGDPHSGNLLFTEDGKLCYLDFGLLVHVSPRHQQAMMAALIHLGLGEWDRLVDDLDNLDLLKPGTNRKKLAEELQDEFAAVLAADSSANNSSTSSSLPLVSLQNSKIKFSTLISVLFKTAFKFKFLLPSYFPLVVRAVASLEGLAVSIDPDFKLVAAGMPVVLNQLLSDRRPAAQELLQEVLLVPGGALRSDDTARQILEVWLSAAQQSAKSQRSSQFSLAFDASNITGIEDMANLLLDRKNVPLRRTLMISNPAATIERMEPEMKEKLVRILTEALRKEESFLMARKLLEDNPASRAQRKRLWILFKATLPKVFSSPPKSILKLVLFTLMLLIAIANTLLQNWLSNLTRIWKKITKNDEYAVP